jgi:hypothetical protein
MIAEILRPETPYRSKQAPEDLTPEQLAASEDKLEDLVSMSREGSPLASGGA